MHKHNVHTLLGIVLCTVALGFGGLYAIVSMNWHRPNGGSIVVLLCWLAGLIFRIVKPAMFSLFIVVAADCVLYYYILGEYFHYHLPKITTYLFSGGSFWICLSIAVIVAADWMFRFRAIRQPAK